MIAVIAVIAVRGRERMNIMEKAVQSVKQIAHNVKQSMYIGNNMVNKTINSSTCRVSSARAKKSMMQAGFTLIEVMVVVVILGILAAVVVPRVMDKPDKARVAKARSDIRALESALNLYKLDNFSYPTTDQGIQALVTKPSGSPEPKNWNKYMDRTPKDPWGEDYQYLATDNEIEIISLGADGALGGEGVNQDIKNTELQ